MSARYIVTIRTATSWCMYSAIGSLSDVLDTAYASVEHGVPSVTAMRVTP